MMSLQFGVGSRTGLRSVEGRGRVGEGFTSCGFLSLKSELCIYNYI